MVKVGICGHYGLENNLLNGQTIKTKAFTEALKSFYGEKSVYTIDTHNWKKNPFKLFFNCYKLTKKCENILIFPAHNGVKIFPSLFIFLNKLFKKKIHYVVIGGWLSQKLENDYRLTNRIRKLDGVYVETRYMMEDLNNLGITNVKVLKNFKDLNILQKTEIKSNYKKTFKLCTFSRVIPEKGIEDAIEVVKRINEKCGEVVYSLDIYGQVGKLYKEKFNTLSKEFPEYINYLGEIDSDKSVEVLKEYYLLLFPTKFYTEGIPGTIIDAYFAGLPTIVSNWQSASEVVIEGETGFIYDFGNLEDLERILIEVSDQPSKLDEMRLYCLEQALTYLPKSVMEVFAQYL